MIGVDAGVGDRLTSVAATRPAGDGDRVGGVAARWVVTPADTRGVTGVLQVASSLGLAVVARGSGTRISWGPPPERLDVIVDLSGLTGVVEHVPGDLVVVVRAGTRLADLQTALALHGQRLALDGEHGAATVGGLVAHGLSGPSRLLHGTLRDLLIGTTMVRTDGVVARSGGKVVKNVAGFDLGKLLHGSWGTLGVITEAVFRLHPVPAARRWVTAPVADPGAAASLTQAVLATRAVPVALELDRPGDGPATLVAMVEGLAATVDGRAGTIAAALGPDATVTDQAPPWWGRHPGAPDDVLLRVTTEVSRLAALLAELPADVRGSAGVGSLMATLPATAEVGSLVSRFRQAMGKWGGSCVVVDGPPDRLAGIDRWGPVAGVEVMERVKERFDPGRVLAPGRFVGSI